MAWSDLETAYGPVSFRIFVKVGVYDRSTGSSSTLRFSDGQEPATDEIDGTVAEWDGRIRGGWQIVKPDQKIGTSRYTHPSCRFQIFAGDADDDLWDSLTVNHEWQNQPATVYLAAWEGSTFLGVSTQIIGTVRKGPEDLQLNSTYSIEIIGLHYKVQLPNRLVTMGTALNSEFVAPVVKSISTSQTRSAISAAQTNIRLYAGGGTDMSAGDVALLANSAGGGGATAGEQVYVSTISLPGGPDQLHVRRGFNGTSALSFTSGAWVYGMNAGPEQAGVSDETTKRAVPYVFCKGTNNRGIFDISDLVAGRTFRTYAPGSLAETWVGAGRGYVVRWWHSASALIGSAGTVTVYNDLTSPLAGAILSWGDAIGFGVTNHHLKPHPQLAGSYVTTLSYNNAGGPQHRNNETRYWAQITGLTDDETPGGAAILYPVGIVQYLLTNSDWSFGFTLSDVVYGSRITGFTTGDWQDEFTEDWAVNIEGAVPAFGDSARPNLMDALQELADVVNSDMWVREGLIYPKRRKVAATADATVDDSDFVINSNPMQLKDPQTIYCNVYRALYSADVLSRPTLADDMPPVQIPMGITLIDHDEVKANNSVSTEVDVSRTWWRQHLTASWIQQQKTAQQNSHLADWTAGNEVQFDQRSQSQVWMESTLSHRFAWLEQGDTIAYDVDPYTSRLGQIRDIRISGGDGKPVTMKVRSWHINF